jgi:hypothetical protein
VGGAIWDMVGHYGGVMEQPSVSCSSYCRHLLMLLQLLLRRTT